MKYVTDSCAADLMVDMVSKGYTTSFTYLVIYNEYQYNN